MTDAERAAALLNVRANLRAARARYRGAAQAHLVASDEADTCRKEVRAWEAELSRLSPSSPQGKVGPEGVTGG